MSSKPLARLFWLPLDRASLASYVLDLRPLDDTSRSSVFTFGSYVLGS